MNINEMLKGVHDCKCGMDHQCAIERVEIGPGAIGKLPEMTEGYAHIVLVCDENTCRILGEKAYALIQDKVDTLLVFHREGLLIPNEEAIEELSQKVTADTDLIVGVGSGVINDTCKYVSFVKGLPYFICATATSMDGYASVGAAMITGNMKTTFNAHVPAAIIGDVDVLKDAPMDMIKSGFGDIIGKYSALNDWRLAHVVNGEYFCQFVYDLVYDIVKKTEALADGILKRDPQTIQTLMEGLVIVGIAMAYVGNSRPASGSEHHLSHYFEITGIVKKRGYLLHGIDVVYSTVETEKLREKIIALGKMPEKTYSFDRADWERHIRDSYGFAADGVIALQDKMGWYQKKLPEIYRAKWNAIIDVLKEVPSSARLCELLAAVDMHTADFDSFYGRDVINDAVLYAKDLKDRYTVLWMYFELFVR